MTLSPSYPFLKTTDLKVGNIYMCRLSARYVLITNSYISTYTQAGKISAIDPDKILAIAYNAVDGKYDYFEPVDYQLYDSGAYEQPNKSI